MTIISASDSTAVYFQSSEKKKKNGTKVSSVKFLSKVEEPLRNLQTAAKPRLKSANRLEMLNNHMFTVMAASRAVLAVPGPSVFGLSSPASL